MKKNLIRTKISKSLSKYPKFFAIAKSIFLLPQQYKQQLFIASQVSPAVPSQTSTEKMIANKRHEAKFRKKKQPQDVIWTHGHFIHNPNAITRIDICIPVFNHFDLVHPLLREIEYQIRFLEKSLNWKFNVLVADDASTLRNQEALQGLCQELSFKYFLQPQNLGVVGNVNSAFQKLDGDFFLLFNSDAQISSNTLVEMVKPLLHDNSVALVTAPNFQLFHNHFGSNLNWKQIGAYLESTAADRVFFVDACTAVSYAISVRRSAIATPNLMDPEYGKGYGEDSDLHYQVVTRGWRSVWTLNTLVSHYGGASFGQSLEANSHRAFGRMLFFTRWGDIYFSEIDAHEEVLRRAIQTRMKDLNYSHNSPIVILTPSDKEHIGGLSIVKSLVAKLINSNLTVQVCVLDEIELRNYYDLLCTSSGDLNALQPAEIIFVGIGSIRWFNENYQKKPVHSKKTFFLQGPDWVIDPSGVNELNWLRQDIDKFITTSDITSCFANQIKNNAEIELFEPKLFDVQFAGHENYEKTHDIMFLLRPEFGKGAHLAEAMIRELVSSCKILVVSEILLNFEHPNLTITKRANQSEFYKKLASCKLYVDTSLYEGYGLVSRQASLLNTKVLLFPFAGGTETLLKYPNHFRTLKNPYDLLGNAELCLQFLNAPSCEHCMYCEKIKYEI